MLPAFSIFLFHVQNSVGLKHSSSMSHSAICAVLVSSVLREYNGVLEVEQLRTTPSNDKEMIIYVARSEANLYTALYACVLCLFHARYDDATLAGDNTPCILLPFMLCVYEYEHAGKTCSIKNQL